MTETSKLRFGRCVEYMFLVIVLFELAMLLSAVISRFKYRLPPHPGASFGHDGRFGFDFAQGLSGLGFTLILLMTIPCLILFILSLTVFRSSFKLQIYRIAALFGLGVVLWLPSLISMMAYSF